MLDKSPGAVVCYHCHRPGAGTICAYCQRQVCHGCVDSDSCPIPRPQAIDLNSGWRLQDIDDSGLFGRVKHVLGKTELWRLDTQQPIAWPRRNAAGVPLLFRAPPAFAAAQVVRPCAMAVKSSQQETSFEPLLMVATLTVDGLVDERFLERPERWATEENLVVTSSDQQYAAIIDDGSLDLINLQTGSFKTLELRQKIHCAAVSDEGLLALGLSSELSLVRLDEGEQINSWREVRCVAFGRQRLMAATKRARWLCSLRIGSKENGADELMIAQRHQLRGPRLLAGDADISLDGKLLAARQDRKRVAIFSEDGAQQQIGRHTDRVCLVRFIKGGEQLVTADKKGAVYFWPRIGDRIVTGE